MQTKLFSSPDSESKKLFLGAEGWEYSDATLRVLWRAPPGPVQRRGAEQTLVVPGKNLPWWRGEVPTNNHVAILLWKLTLKKQIELT